MLQLHENQKRELWSTETSETHWETWRMPNDIDQCGSCNEPMFVCLLAAADELDFPSIIEGVRGSNLRAADHFIDWRQIFFARNVTRSDLARPHMVLCHSKFLCHGRGFPSSENYWPWNMSFPMHLRFRHILVNFINVLENAKSGLSEGNK